MKNNVKEFFDDFSDIYDKSAFGQSLGTKWLSKLETDFIIDALQVNIDNRINRVLEIGVGTGRNAKLLLDRGIRIEGLDTSEGMIRKAQEKLIGRDINFIVNDVGKCIPFKDSTFDGSVCIRVLKYIPNWKYTIKEISRVLKKDGIFILEIANLYSVQYFGLYNANYFLFNIDEVKRTLNDNGLSIVAIKDGARIAFPIYKRINSYAVLDVIIGIESLLDKILPKYFLSRNILIKCQKR